MAFILQNLYGCQSFSRCIVWVRHNSNDALEYELSPRQHRENGHLTVNHYTKHREVGLIYRPLFFIVHPPWRPRVRNSVVFIQQTT